MATSKKSARITGMLFGAYAISQAYIATLLRPLGRDVLRLQTTADPDELRQIMAAWTPEQRAQYRKHLLPDTLHPLLYSSALIAAGLVGHRASTPRCVRVAAVAAPALSAGCDLVENGFHAAFITRPDRISQGAARASTLFTRTKWLLALGTAGTLLGRVLHKRRTRS